MQERFAGNTAHIEAGTSQVRGFIDKGGLQTQLRPFDGGHVATRATPNHGEVKRIFGHVNSLEQGNKEWGTITARIESPTDPQWPPLS